MTMKLLGIMILALGATVARADAPEPKPLVTSKPVKVTAADAAGPIFKSPAAARENGPDGPANDVLLLRSEHPIPDKEREKIALFCNVRKSAVIAAPDLKTIYDAPLAYHREGLDQAVLDAFAKLDIKFGDPDLYVAKPTGLKFGEDRLLEDGSAMFVQWMEDQTQQVVFPEQFGTALALPEGRAYVVGEDRRHRGGLLLCRDWRGGGTRDGVALAVPHAPYGSP